MTYTISLGKEQYKFSSSHFTIFEKAKGERLHGHNYQVVCELEVSKIDAKLGMAFDFNELKPHIKKLCDNLDEFVLIPQKSPYLKIEASKKQIEVNFGEKNYSFPKEDVKLLDIANITVEELAQYFWSQLRPKLHKNVEGMSITVTETQGQSVKFESEL